MNDDNTEAAPPTQPLQPLFICRRGTLRTAPPAYLALLARIKAGANAIVRQRIVAAEELIRSPKTFSSYHSYQRLFLHWCESLSHAELEMAHSRELSEAQAVHLRYVVTESKMVTFIVGRKDGRIGFSPSPAKFEILNVTKAALLDLMKLQYAYGLAPSSRERSVTLDDILSSAQRNDSAVVRVDQTVGARTEMESLTRLGDLQKLAAYYFSSGTSAGMRDRLFALLSSACCLRCDSFRNLRLNNAYVIERERTDQIDGQQAVHELVLCLPTSKTNHDGRPDQVGCIRNKVVDICPVGALAFYYFERFNVLGERYPTSMEEQRSFIVGTYAVSHDHQQRQRMEGEVEVEGSDSDEDEPEHFENPFFIQATDNTVTEERPEPTRLANVELPAPLSHQILSKSISVAFEALGFTNLRAKTHSFRTFGVHRIRNNGGPTESVRQHGHWNVQDSVYRYNTPTSKEAVFAYAGFNTNGTGFFLRRNFVVPSEALQRMVFPGFDEFVESLQREPARKTPGMMRHISVVKELRIVFLQDSVALMVSGTDEYKLARFFTRPIFQTAEFLAFKAALVPIFSQANVPGERVYQHFELGPRMDSLETSVNALQSIVAANQVRTENLVREEGSRLRVQLQAHMERRETFTVHVTRNSPADDVAMEGPRDVEETRPVATVEPGEFPASFSFRRGFRNVRDFVVYWFLADNAIVSLEERYGCAWRQSCQNKRAFFEYKPLAALIEFVRGEVHDWDEVIRLVEIERNRRSIPVFAKVCRAQMAADREQARAQQGNN